MTLQLKPIQKSLDIDFSLRTPQKDLKNLTLRGVKPRTIKKVH